MEERRIRECILNLGKKGSDKSQALKQDGVEHKHEINKARNGKDEPKGSNAVSNAREPF